jgi:stringent starvation protein B
MTFSEFTKTYALQAYLDYCKRNHLTPKVDVVPEATIKLCALVKPKETNA